MRSVECDESTLKPFIYNNEFTVTKQPQYFVNGEIRFPNEPLVRRAKGDMRADGSYDTVFGPYVEHDGKKYEVSNHNVRLAMRRLTRCRVDLSTHTRLKRQQIVWFFENQEFVQSLCEHYAPGFNEYSGMEQEALDHHADVHAKRALRIAGWKELVDTGILGENLWLRKVVYKMKKFEWAKVSKEPRMIGDLGILASLQGFRTMELTKQAMFDYPLHYKGGIIMYCKKPSHSILKHIFEELIHPTRRFFFVYFSDDSCYSVHTPTGVYRANVDISGCDSSHGAAMFASFINIHEGRAKDDVKRLVAQCELPIRVYDLGQDSKQAFVELLPHEPKLYSGSTMTTAINNFANICIAKQVADDCAMTDDAVAASAAKVGYIVTCVDAAVPEKLQFLKHSPALDTSGNWQPLLNLGVLLRLSGSCRFDLPGRGPLEPRARAFQAALLQGAYPRSIFPLITNMKRACGATTTPVCTAAVSKLFEYKVDRTDDDPTLTFHSADVYRRYDLDSAQQSMLDNVFGNSSYGDFHSSDAASLVLQLDYGFKCT